MRRPVANLFVLLAAIGTPACVGQIVEPHETADGAVPQDASQHDASTPDTHADAVNTDAHLDAAVTDASAIVDAPSISDAPAPGHDVLTPADVYTPPPTMSCSGSASGTSAIWTCTTDHSARQRCVSSALQTETCPNGCVGQPTGVDDFCAASPPPPGSGVISCAYPQWWNAGYSWSPGFYAINYWGYHWDNDLAVRTHTPVQLRHASTLVEQSVHPWGWEPRFIDTVTGEHFAFLHMQPDPSLTYTTVVGMTYAAGTLVGLSGGDTTPTGYMVSDGTGGVYSTGAHLCVTTDHPFGTAFPPGTDTCH